MNFFSSEKVVNFIVCLFRQLENENAQVREEYQSLKSTNNGLPHFNSTAAAKNLHSNDAEILQEAKMLRDHKDRLESRMRILEVHNQQLESQLSKLKQLLQEEVTQYF